MAKQSRKRNQNTPEETADKAAQRAEEGPRAGNRRSRRPDVVKNRKQSRIQETERQRKQWLWTRIGLGAVALVLIGGLAITGWNFGSDLLEERRVMAEVDDRFGAQDIEIYHREGDILYGQLPPVGGIHNGLWQNCGFYDSYILNQHAVHSLEHGAVWINYDPELDEEQLDNLRERAEQSSWVLVSPYPGLDSPIVASAWGSQIEIDHADDWQLDAFLSAYENNQSNVPEPQGMCYGGVSLTTEEEPQTEPFTPRDDDPEPFPGVPEYELEEEEAADD